MVRTKRRQAGNLTTLLLGVGSAIACVSGSTPDGGSDVACAPDCAPGLVCDDGTCVPPTQTGGAAGSSAGGAGTGGAGLSRGKCPTGGESGTGTGGVGNAGGAGGAFPTGGSGGAFPTGGAPMGGVGNTGAMG